MAQWVRDAASALVGTTIINTIAVAMPGVREFSVNDVVAAMVFAPAPSSSQSVTLTTAVTLVVAP